MRLRRPQPSHILISVHIHPFRAERSDTGHPSSLSKKLANFELRISNFGWLSHPPRRGRGQEGAGGRASRQSAEEADGTRGGWWAGEPSIRRGGGGDEWRPEGGRAGSSPFPFHNSYFILHTSPKNFPMDKPHAPCFLLPPTKRENTKNRFRRWSLGERFPSPPRASGVTRRTDKGRISSRALGVHFVDPSKIDCGRSIKIVVDPSTGA
jgi:hypothetical protein